MKQLLILLLLSNAVFAAGPTGTNNVYIEQLGSTNTIIIDQIGGTNNIGGTTLVSPISYGANNIITSFVPSAAATTNYATITGSTNQVTLNQTGDGNWAQYNITGNNNIYSSLITGMQNQTLLTIGVVGTPSSTNIVNETVSGDTNFIIQSLTKDNIHSTIAITGSSNQITTRLNSMNGVDTTTAIGNFNSFINEQDKGGVGHQLTQLITGDFNSIVTQQQGSNDSMIDINTTGNNNTITVHSTNDATLGIVGLKSAVAR